MTNRYSGAFQIIAYPHLNGNEPIAELELAEPQFVNDIDAQTHRDVCGNYLRSDRFKLSAQFKKSDAAFKHQLLVEINGITPKDADVIVAARNALRALCAA